MENIMLILAVIATLATVMNVVILLSRSRKKDVKTKDIIRNPKIYIPLVLAIGFGFGSFWPSIPIVPKPAIDQSRYGFESGTMGWTHQTYSDSKGVTEVAQSNDQAKSGKYSLKLSVDLEGGHENRTKGEAYMQIAVQSLENKAVTVWVYIPKEAVGDPKKPNGVQVFVKDTNWKAAYGTWWDITPGRVDSWQQVTLMPSKTVPPDGYMEPGFDPTQIRAVGAKVAIGDGSTATYEGPIYIDAVDWP